MSGTIAEVELVFGDGLYDFAKGKLVKIPLPLGWAAGRVDLIDRSEGKVN